MPFAGLSPPYSRLEWKDWIQQGLKQANHREAKVYIQVTRGVAPRDHAFPPHSSPTTVMTIRELHPLAVEARINGVTARTTDDIRFDTIIKPMNGNGDTQPVPEPSAYGMVLGAGLASLVVWRRRGRVV